jgi:hypothetical protein
MTHRAGEDFTLISLSDIQSSQVVVAGAPQPAYYPFLPFKDTFIDANTIQLLTNGSVDIFQGMYNDRNAIGFFDSLHDFKSDFFDCQAQIKGDQSQYSYKKFMFTFLLKGGYVRLFDRPQLVIQDKYSYLNRLPRPLNQDNLENYFSIGNILDTIRDSRKGQMYILPQTRIPREASHKLSIYNKLKGFFAGYRDPTFNNTIKLVVDMQLNLFDIIKTSRGEDSDFSILYTAETITDPAPKTKAKKLYDIFGAGNWYIESLPGTRMYDPVADEINGNVGVNFTNIRITDPVNLENAEFSVTTTYKYDNDPSKALVVPVKMNQKENTIQNIKNNINRFIKGVTGAAGVAGSAVRNTFTSSMFSKVTSRPSQRVEFYTDFNDQIQRDGTNDFLQEYTIDYARKRLGDTLQGRVCLIDKLSTLAFKNVMNVGKTLGGVIGQVTRAAVLVTHDRMLFSYAVINDIPTILDLQEHMIVFVPTHNPDKHGSLAPQGGGGEEKPLLLKNSLLEQEDPLQQEEVLIQKGGNIYDTDTMSESILNNVDDLIRFLYFFADRRTVINREFPSFIENVNTGLFNKTLEYAYVGEYETNCLIIAPTSGELQIILAATNVTSPKYNLRSGIKQSPKFLHIKLDNDNFVEVEIYDDNTRLIMDQSKNKLRGTNFGYSWNKGDIQNLLGKSTGTGIIGNLQSQTGSNEEDINSEKFNEFNITEPEPVVLTWVQRIMQIGLYGLLGTAVVAGTTQYLTGSNPYIATGTAIAAASALVVPEAITGLKRKRGGGPNDMPFFQLVLQTKFELLNNPKNLLPNNITVLYYLFNLLQTYETSFIGYQEGIDTFYTKIDESCILSDMIGVTNLIPHNIEFYVFLKLILEDYSEKNVTTINYALFEYYLYMFKNFYNTYDQFQSIKSYLLNVNYTIETSEDIIRDISKNNTKSLKYFQSVLLRADKISKTIIIQNYDATQEGNFNIIHKNADDYSLKLRGFMDMKGEFMVKTYNIIKSMASKGLLLQYTEKTEIEGVSSFDDSTSDYKTSTPDDITPMRKIAAYGGKKTSIRKNRRKIKKTKKHGSKKYGNKKTLKKHKKITRKTYKRKSKL